PTHEPDLRSSATHTLLLRHTAHYATHIFYLPLSPPHLDLHSFPTRRSPDLEESPASCATVSSEATRGGDDGMMSRVAPRDGLLLDRKSTRLNSSHVSISYAVFCLKKKKVQLSYPVPYFSHHI